MWDTPFRCRRSLDLKPADRGLWTLCTFTTTTRHIVTFVDTQWQFVTQTMCKMRVRRLGLSRTVLQDSPDKRSETFRSATLALASAVGKRPARFRTNQSSPRRSDRLKPSVAVDRHSFVQNWGREGR